MTARILALDGSLRADSWNRRVLLLAAEGARTAGAEVTVTSLRDHPMPLFDEDLERRDGPPEGARSLRTLFLAHQGLLIASPEYNSSLTAALKNAIDWVSRPVPGEPPLAAFSGKSAALLAASPGTLGGLRGLVHLRAILGNLGVLVLPEQVAVARVHEALTAEGALKDARIAEAVAGLGRALARIVARLGA